MRVRVCLIVVAYLGAVDTLSHMALGRQPSCPARGAHLRPRVSLISLNAITKADVRSDDIAAAESAATAIAAKPKWRGHLHRNGAIVFPLVAWELCHSAAAVSARELRAALMFSGGVEGILAVSAILHTTDWRRLHPKLARKVPEGQIFHPNWMRLLDYSMIFIGIGLICTSIGGLIMGHERAFRFIIAPIVWGSAVVGITSKAFILNSARWVEAAAFLLQGWACILGYPLIRAALTAQQLMWMFGGGLCFTLGVTAYVFQWPDFHWHRDRFRAHEAFHLSTIAGFSCFAVLLRSLILRGA